MSTFQKVFYQIYSVVAATIITSYKLSFEALLPTRLEKRLRFVLQSIVAIFQLFLGRILPDLNPPLIDLTGKIAIVTGANSGIGLQLATDLARQNAIVYLACRSEAKAQQAIASIHDQYPSTQGRVKALLLDTSDMSSVQEFVTTWSKLENTNIDILMLNAGIVAPPATTSSSQSSSTLKDINEYTDPSLSKDNIPLLYATNFLCGAFLLTYHLEQYLSPTARVILTSSHAQYSAQISHNFSLGPVRGISEPGFHHPSKTLFSFLGDTFIRTYNNNNAHYNQSKAMQVAFAKLLQRRFDIQSTPPSIQGGKLTKRTVHAFTPGATSTPVFTKFSNTNDPFNELMAQFVRVFGALATDVRVGAATGVYLATTNDDAVTKDSSNVTGGGGGYYWDRMQQKMTVVDFWDEVKLRRLWTRWERDAGVRWDLQPLN